MHVHGQEICFNVDLQMSFVSGSMFSTSAHTVALVGLGFQSFLLV